MPPSSARKSRPLRTARRASVFSSPSFLLCSFKCLSTQLSLARGGCCCSPLVDVVQSFIYPKVERTLSFSFLARCTLNARTSVCFTHPTHHHLQSYCFCFKLCVRVFLWSVLFDTLITTRESVRIKNLIVLTVCELVSACSAPVYTVRHAGLEDDFCCCCFSVSRVTHLTVANCTTDEEVVCVFLFLLLSLS